MGQEDSSKEIWTDPSTVEVHPVGYSAARGWTLEPPAELKHLNLSSQTAPLVEQHRAADCEASMLSPALQMKAGLVVEVEDLHESRTVWTAEIKRNVGGRLFLQYTLPSSIAADDVVVACQEWIFCLSPRLHWKGWADQSWSYKPPTRLRSLFADQWEAMAETFRAGEKSPKPWQFNLAAPTHQHKVGDVVQALNPQKPHSLVQATVVEVIDERRYSIRLPGSDDSSQKEDGDVLLNCFAARGEEADCDFEVNMALEVVNPSQPAEVCVGVITALEENGTFLRIRPELDGAAEFYVSAYSHDLFPVGWCDSQNYPLTAPAVQPSSAPPAEPSAAESKLINLFVFSFEILTQLVTLSGQVPAEEKAVPAEAVAEAGATAGGSGVSFWCPKIYFNFRCFSGPLLSRIRVAALPRSVGPGPIGLVMKEVLSQLMNGAYKPGSVLKQLQGEPSDPIPPGTSLEPMKAKYRQTTYRGTVPVACTAAVVPDYCRWVCDKLQCCPYLFGPELVGDPCPHRCCILAKAVWQHKKKAPNWRHRRFVDILKSSENLPPDAMLVSEPVIAAAKAEPAALIESAEQSNDEDSSQSDGKDVEDEPAAKKFKSNKRGRAGTKKPTSSQDRPPAGHRKTRSSSAAMLRIPADAKPHLWTSKDVWRFLQSTDCRPLADRLLEQEVDGPSLLLLRPADVADYVTFNWQLALRLCRLVDSLRLTYSA